MCLFFFQDHKEIQLQFEEKIEECEQLAESLHSKNELCDDLVSGIVHGTWYKSRQPSCVTADGRYTYLWHLSMTFLLFTTM